MIKINSSNKKYSPDSAGFLMITDVLVVDEDSKVKEIEKILIEKVTRFSSVNYIYITNKKKRLTGVISIKELFRSPGEKPAKQLSPLKLITASGETDKEKVAMLALKKNLKEVPIVDKNKKLLGVVPNDAILKILHEEATEDLLRLGGVGPNTPFNKNIFSLPLTTSIKNRLPWLIIGLLGGLLAAGIIGYFEEVLTKHIILAAFIPLIVYMSDAVGSQMQAFIIRDLAFDSKLNFAKYLGRQASVVLIMGLVISVFLYLISFIIYQEAAISFILALALFLAILTSLLTGLIIPFLFSRLRLDPANISGPIATIIQDVLSVLVYFLIASILL